MGLCCGSPSRSLQHMFVLCFSRPSCFKHSRTTQTASGPWYYFPRAAITNHHSLGDFKQQEVYSLTILEARSPKLKCSLGHAPSKVSRKDSCFACSNSGDSRHSLACSCMSQIYLYASILNDPFLFYLL